MIRGRVFHTQRLHGTVLPERLPTLLDKRLIIFRWRYIVLAEIHGHGLPGFRTMPQHRHKALVLVVSPLCIRFEEYFQDWLVHNSPINRYAMEIKRQLDVLNQNLASRRYLCGDDYNIADIITYPWYGALVLDNIYEASEFLDVASCKNVVRWAQEIEERPAVLRGRRVNRVWGPEEKQMAERHDASDFGDEGNTPDLTTQGVKL